MTDSCGEGRNVGSTRKNGIFNDIKIGPIHQLYRSTEGGRTLVINGEVTNGYIISPVQFYGRNVGGTNGFNDRISG